MPTPTATVMIPYHALDDLILRGTRAAQPPASAVVAGTLYGVTDEGNLVERSTGTVWQAYSPTGGGGGAPAAHHATHEPGGSDPMAVDAAAATGSLRTLGTGATQAAPGNDARFAAGTAAHHVSHEPGGADALVNAAWTNQANVFTAALQQIGPAATPRLSFYDTAPPADARVFRIMDAFQLFWIDALDDAQTTVLATPLQLTRGGDALVGRDLYEKGRATPLGHWIDFAYAAGTFTALAPMSWTVTAGNVLTNRYMVVGKTLTWAVYLTATTTGGTPSNTLYLFMPPGYVAAKSTGMAVTQIYDGTYRRALALTDAASNVLKLQIEGAANFALVSGGCYVIFTLTFEVQ